MILLLLCITIFIFALILGLVSSEFFNTNLMFPRKKESFLLTPQGASIDKTTGAMKGVGLITDGLLSSSNWTDIEKSVIENKSGFDGSRGIGVGINPDGLDKAYANYQDVLTIEANAENGVRSPDDSKEISKKLAVANNSQNNLYSRGGGYPTKMILAPNEVRCVIDEKYLPERDRNRQLAVVSTIIHAPGFDVNTERLGVNLMDTHFSNVSRNSSRRIPTAAGSSREEPNKLALQQKVQNDGNFLKISREGPGGQSTEIIAAPVVESSGEEKFSKKYALNNFKVFSSS